jgi:carboxymethylenebutenolidase
MCHDPDGRPPIAPIAGAAVDGSRVEVQSADGARFLGFAADASSPSGAGIVILPDVRGLHPFYEELALRFAEEGIDALAIDYFGRTAGVGPRGGDFEHMPHVEQARFPTIRADIQAAAWELRQRRGVRSLFTVGFCFGGRLAFLTAADSNLQLAGAIGFYGVLAGPGRAQTRPPLDAISEMRCPVLGLFGGADPGIPAEDVERFRQGLIEAGVENEIVVYPGAPHSFFDRKAADFKEAADDAWQRVLRFVRRINSAP